MIGVRADVDTSELARAMRDVERLQQRASLGATTMRRIAYVMLRQTRDRLDTEKTAPDGTPWPPWSASYAATRDPGDSLLQGSMRLTNALRATSDRDTATVYVLSSVKYAGTHQYGYGAIPERPYLGLSAANMSEIERMLAEDVI
jgi:phage virion morphogenesis protein